MMSTICLSKATAGWTTQEVSDITQYTISCYYTLRLGTSSLNSEALPLGGDSGDDMNSDMFGSTQTLTSFGSSDFEVVDDTEM